MTPKPYLTLILGGADASEALRLLRRIFRKLAQMFALAEPLPAPEDQNDWYRASGDIECDVCGELYYSHAEDPREPWMTIVCGGRRVKL